MFGATNQRPRRERTLGRLVMRSLDAVPPQRATTTPTSVFPACHSPGQPEQLRARPGRPQAPPPTSRAARTSSRSSAGPAKASTDGPAPETTAGTPSARSASTSPAVSGMRRRPVLLVQPVLGGRQQQARVGGQRVHEQRGPAPRSRAASACGTVSGSSLRASRSTTRRRRARTPPAAAPGWLGSRTAAGRAVRRRPGQGEPAEQAGRDVVRVPLDLGGQRQQRGVVERVGAAERPARGRRRARPRSRPRRSRGRGRAGSGWRRPPRGRAAGRRARRSRPAGPARPGAGGSAARCRRPRRPRRRTGPRRRPGPPRRRTGPGPGRGRRSRGRGWRWSRGRAPAPARPGTPPGTLAPLPRRRQPRA